MKNENIIIKTNIHIQHICLKERKEQIMHYFLLTH